MYKKDIPQNVLDLIEYDFSDTEMIDKTKMITTIETLITDYTEDRKDAEIEQQRIDKKGYVNKVYQVSYTDIIETTNTSILILQGYLKTLQGS